MTAAFRLESTDSPTPVDERAAKLVDPGFGRVFTDHVAVANYNDADGWHDVRITRRTPLVIDPACAVLHYAQEIFEGLKAYRLPDGDVALFRPEANARRFRLSARRMAMPELPEELFVESCRALIRLDRDWMPPGDEGTIYLRPFMIASETFLGVKPASEFLYIVLASSVGSYWRGDVAVKLWVSEHYNRAGPGGTGAAKCGGNYAASLVAQAEGIRNGCDQVVFLDTVERRWVEELGGMNIFFVFADGSLATPPLSDTILAGITRDSVIQLARDQGLTVREEPYAIDQWRADAESGRLAEAFACGTAAVVTPIGEVRSAGGAFTIGSGGPGQLTGRLRAGLIALQRGHAPDPYGWLDRLG